MTHIPSGGSANSVPAPIGRQVDLVIAAYLSLAGFVKTGQARILATNAAQRSPLAAGIDAIGGTPAELEAALKAGSTRVAGAARLANLEAG